LVNFTGSNYYIGFFQNNNGGSISLYLTNTGSLDLFYTVEAPGARYYTSGTISTKNSAYVQLPSSLIAGSYNDQNKGIYLQTNTTHVTVIGQNLYSHNTGGDTFLALPTVTLCITNQFLYYGISVYSGTYDNVILIVGTENDTKMELTVTQSVSVRIDNSINYLSSDVQYSFNIRRLQTVYIGSPRDMTGTRIVTDKPVSVFSGHECGYVRNNNCEHLVEQILPTMYWGRTYYIAPLRGRNGYTIRVLAASNSTNVVMYCDGTRSSYTINAGKTFTVTRGALNCAIHSDKEILVAQYSHGYYHDYTGDPMMMLVPAKVHYSNEINLSTSSSSGYNNYINIIVLKEYYQPYMMFLMTGGVKRSLQSQSWTPIIFQKVTEAYYTQLSVSQSAITIMHTNANALISVVVYGFRFGSGYGHSGGFSIVKNFPG